MSSEVKLPKTIRKILSCRWCDYTEEVLLDPNAFERWNSGELIQRAFPDLTSDQRELMISGTCGVCWDEVFR